MAIRAINCVARRGTRLVRNHAIRRLAGAKGMTMFDNFETLQKIGKENVDAALKGFGVASKGLQAIATEVADFQKKSFEEGTAALEKLMGAKTLDKAVEAQTEYYKTAYEGFVSKAAKIGELYADIAKESYKPLEGAFAKASKQ
jgi:hypothetical protein